MKYFPATCIDDFYTDPDTVRQMALGQEFEASSDGKWPGKRTSAIHTWNRPFFDMFCERLFSIYFDLDRSSLKWKVDTSFQLIMPFDTDPGSPKNTGWIHTDGHNCVFAGVIYLTPGIQSASGTSIYNLRPNCLEQINQNHAAMVHTKRNFFKNAIDDGFDQGIQEHNSYFEESARFNNRYNRLVSYDGETWHAANSYHSIGEPRLTQVFFVDRIETDVPPPITRSKQKEKL